MKSVPLRVINIISRIIIALSALFSGLNLLFIHLDNGRLMPMALSMSGYLDRAGIQMSTNQGNPFFSVYSLILASVLCAVFLLCPLLCGRNIGWLITGAVIFLADCAGIALLILRNGYRSGFWFEIAGHAVVFAAIAAAFCTMSSAKKTAE